MNLLKKVDIKHIIMSNFRRTFTKEQRLEIVKQSPEESAVIENLAAQYNIHFRVLFLLQISAGNRGGNCIFNQNGALVRNFNSVDRQDRINIADLPAGKYTLSIIGGNLV
jgi:hypothetical protein